MMIGEIVVSKKEFFAKVGVLNVHPQIQAPEVYPYTELWKTPDGVVRGRTVGLPDGGTRYFIPATGRN